MSSPSKQRVRTESGAASHAAPEGGRWRPVVFAILALVALGVAFWTVVKGPEAWLPAPWDNERALRIGYAVEAPYAFVDPAGRVTGEGPEVARVIAERLGVKETVWRQVEFGQLIHELREGAIDMIAAGMLITAEREVLVSFSRPKLRVAPGLLVKAGNPLGLRSYEDVRRAGARLAVLADSHEESVLGHEGGSAAVKLLVFADSASAVRAVEAGAADVLALSVPTLRWAVSRAAGKGLEVVEVEAGPGRDGGPQSVGFAFRRQDRWLRRAWNQEMAKFIGSAEHLELLAAVGLTRSELPVGEDERGAEKGGTQ